MNIENSVKVHINSDSGSGTLHYHEPSGSPGASGRRNRRRSCVARIALVLVVG